MDRHLTLTYSGIQGTYWMYYAAICSFASVYLTDRGYSNENIGMILALGSIFAVVLQPILADFADRSRKLSLAGIITGIAGGLFLGTACLPAFVQKSGVLTFLFIMLVAWHAVLQPLINSLSFKLEEKGVFINFGVARSMGSLAYSILCSFLGTLVSKLGVSVLPVTAEIVLVLMFVSIYLTNKQWNRGSATRAVLPEAAKTGKSKEKEISLKYFLLNNRIFALLNCAVVFIFFGNSILNSFMMQIVGDVGGTNGDLGRLLSLMAFLEIPTLFFFNRVKKVISYETMLKLAAGAFTLKMLLFYVSKSTAFLYIAQGFQPFSFALFLPAMVHFTNKIMSKGEAVKGQALFTIMITVSTVFASAAGGYILDSLGAKPLLLLGTILSFIGFVIVLILVDKANKKGNNI